MAYFVRNKLMHRPVYKLLTFEFLLCSKFVDFIEKMCVVVHVFFMMYLYSAVYWGMGLGNSRNYSLFLKILTN